MKHRALNMDNSGQTIIVLVMVVAIITIIFTHVAFINASALLRSNEVVSGDIIRIKTEGYLENAAIRFVRNPSYTGESLNEGSLSCTITIADMGGGVHDIETVCEEDERTKTLGLTVTQAGGVYEFSKISER